MEILDRQLRYFLTFAELKSVSKAAEMLDQTQSGLSKQLALLEAALGQAVFTRTGRGLELTEIGAQLYESISPAYREIDIAVDNIRRQGITHGTVRVAMVHPLSYYFTADLVSRFTGAHPNVNVSLMGRSAPDVVTLVENGKADIGLVYDSAVDSGELVTQHLFEDQMTLIVREGSSLDSPQDLTTSSLRLVAFPSQYALRRMIHSSGIPAKIVAETETVDAMLRLVSSGIGECILPARIPPSLLAEYNLRPLHIAKPLMRRKVVLIYLKQKKQSALASDLIQCAQHIAEKNYRHAT